MPSHTVTSNITVSTFAQQIALGDWTTFFGYSAALYAGFGSTVMAVDAFMVSVFQDFRHDLIVPEASQGGGCGKTTSLNPFWHSAIKENSAQFTVVEQILKQSAIDTSIFSIEGFNPPSLTSIYHINENKHHQTLSTGDVFFTNLQDLDTITSNMQATFEIASSGSVQRMFLAVIGSPQAIMFADTVAPSASITFNIDNKIFGRAKLMLIGYDSAGVIDVDTIEIAVKDYPGYECSSISAFPEISYLAQGSLGTIQTSVSYSAGERYLNSAHKCTYEILDPSIAENIASNRFRGLKPGVTKVVVQYNDLTDTVNIVVLDTILDEAVTGVEMQHRQKHHQEVKGGFETAFVKAYPNPFESIVTFIIAESVSLSNASLVIWDMMGRIVSRTDSVNERLLNVNLEKLESGLYFYRLATDAWVTAGKVMKE